MTPNYLYIQYGAETDECVADRLDVIDSDVRIYHHLFLFSSPSPFALILQRSILAEAEAQQMSQYWNMSGIILDEVSIIRN